jgi:hypothetical protein
MPRTPSMTDAPQTGKGDLKTKNIMKKDLDRKKEHVLLCYTTGSFVHVHRHYIDEKTGFGLRGRERLRNIVDMRRTDLNISKSTDITSSQL